MRDLRDVLVAEYGLNLNGWILGQALGISADGRTIVGQGTNPDGFDASWIAYLGTPVPEPSTAALAAMAIALVVRRNRGSQSDRPKLAPSGRRN